MPYDETIVRWPLVLPFVVLVCRADFALETDRSYEKKRGERGDHNEGEIEKTNHHDRANSCLRSGVRWDRVRRVTTDAARSAL